MLKHGILGLLNYHEMTGYEIMEVFRDSLNYFWDAKTSQIYRELHGLEQKEWVSKTVILQSGKPDKNMSLSLVVRSCCDGWQMMIWDLELRRRF